MSASLCTLSLYMPSIMRTSAIAGVDTDHFWEDSLESNSNRKKRTKKKNSFKIMKNALACFLFYCYSLFRIRHKQTMPNHHHHLAEPSPRRKKATSSRLPMIPSLMGAGAHTDQLPSTILQPKRSIQGFDFLFHRTEQERRSAVYTPKHSCLRISPKKGDSMFAPETKRQRTVWIDKASATESWPFLPTNNNEAITKQPIEMRKTSNKRIASLLGY